MKHTPDNKTDRLASLVEDYPELAQGLDQLLTDDTNQVVGVVGIFSILQLRLRSVMARLPQVAPSSSEESLPGEGR